MKPLIIRKIEQYTDFNKKNGGKGFHDKVYPVK